MKRSTLIISILLINMPALSNIDVTFIGRIKFADGLGQLIVGLAEVLKDDLTFNHVRLPGTYYDFTDIAPALETALKNPDPTAGNVSFLLYPLWRKGLSAADYVPKESLIKLAYSMVESTRIPEQWVAILNEQFDGVVVPDQFYQKVYEESGVKIPVFVVPHGVYLEELLNEPLREHNPSQPFVFGLSASFRKRKNHELVIEAFHKAFGNDERFILVIHGRTSHNQYKKELEQKIHELDAQNIHIIESFLSDKEYKELLKSFDCYVLLSKGEGFSISPREALALGTPTIISDNTAHQTICRSGAVYPVPFEIRQNADYSHHGWGYCGEDFNGTVEDAAQALKEVYDNYEWYKKKALQGREWVKQYLWEQVKPQFLSLLKPKRVLLGAKNTVSAEYIMTRSKELYDKYQQLIAGS